MFSEIIAMFKKRWIRKAALVLVPLAWAAMVVAALRTKALFPEDEYSVCGPWGCGPEAGALVAMHAVWLVLLAPPILYLPCQLHWPSKVLRWVSSGMFAGSLVGILAIVVWQWIFWLPQAGEIGPNYIWQRCGYAIVTTVDWPLMPTLILSSVAWLIVMIRSKNVVEHTT
jgi:hypothetical protein